MADLSPCNSGGGRRWTRRGFIVAASAVTGALTGHARAARSRFYDRTLRSIEREYSTPRFFSRPDLMPPAVNITTPAVGTESGYLFVAPFASGTDGRGTSHNAGPLIIDDQGAVVWFRPMTRGVATNFRVQRYRGRPVLTWYEGELFGKYGGELVIMDDRYRQLARIRARHSLAADLHEFLITARDTALISIYNDIHVDLSSLGQASNTLVEGVIQEVDLPTGRVLFEWHSRHHVGLDESYFTDVTPAGNVDYFHLNSIAVDHDGHLLVSARNTATVYKLDRHTGHIKWRLGGKRSDFTFGNGAEFHFQHDVRRHNDGTLTIFDNAGADPTAFHPSRAIRLRLDMKRKRAILVATYEPATPRSAWAMGNAEQLADHGLFVGWGTAGSFSEFAPDGQTRLDASFADGSLTYRAFRFRWDGRPTSKPAVVVQNNADGTKTIYVSWNGATDVAHWQVREGSTPSRLRPVATVPREGFETRITVALTGAYLSVAALDRQQRPLAATNISRI